MLTLNPFFSVSPIDRIVIFYRVVKKTLKHSWIYWSHGSCISFGVGMCKTEGYNGCFDTHSHSDHALQLDFQFENGEQLFIISCPIYITHHWRSWGPLGGDFDGRAVEKSRGRRAHGFNLCSARLYIPIGLSIWSFDTPPFFLMVTPKGIWCHYLLLCV